jgi:hypothetical protein
MCPTHVSEATHRDGVFDLVSIPMSHERYGRRKTRALASLRSLLPQFEPLEAEWSRCSGGRFLRGVPVTISPSPSTGNPREEVTSRQEAT